MAIHDLKGQIARLPEQPGVYLFLGAAGETLYVGKARVLRDRVRSYLGAQGASPRLDALLRDASALDVIVTDSVVEALALENRLIKQRNPRFNVLLRDDKTYPYLQLTTTERAPRLLVARQVARDGNVYAGPFMPAAVARRTMSLAHRLFGIRSCNEVIDGKRDRPCLEHDIGRCLAPCVESLCTIERYREAVGQAQLLIEGRQDELVGRLRDDMNRAADRQEYERAAHLRDAARTVATLGDWRNKMETPSLGDYDAFGVKAGPSGGVIEVFQMRRGRVADRIELVTERGHEWLDAGTSDEGTLVCIGVQQFYAERQPPPQIHLPVELPPDERDAVEAWLSERAGRRVRVMAPRRGERRGLLDLAARNAALAYVSHFAEGAGSGFEALDTLRDLLALPALPRRIECFDISTFQGRETVASMVVAIEGRPRKGEYRKFKIRGLLGVAGREGREGHEGAERGPDDFAAMYEVVFRRYKRALEQGGPFPDLIVIDGGKGQLSAAYAALREIGLDKLVAIGLAKEEELIFTRDRAEGLFLPRESAALRLLQRIRDEAHRFAVTFHRQRRAKRDFSSALDAIAGIGSRRRRQLLTAFGSVAGVRRAGRDELARVVGAKAADAVIRHFTT
ncbi:MAG TPA: excinuclease ABC subunit UvrC [Vicinamibacterales bacterium]|nr:excinuclease ABC subunit UvrC [Vicinamibacterales bacterium]